MIERQAKSFLHPKDRSCLPCQMLLGAQFPSAPAGTAKARGDGSWRPSKIWKRTCFPHLCPRPCLGGFLLLHPLSRAPSRKPHLPCLSSRDRFASKAPHATSAAVSRRGPSLHGGAKQTSCRRWPQSPTKSPETWLYHCLLYTSPSPRD